MPADDVLQKVGAMRMKFEKKFEGGLVATSVVAMMGMMDQKKGSGGYVALERVVGEIEGLKGSFCLQHSSFMTRGVPLQKIQVIPDTGTDELEGLTGDMVIEIIDSQHYYTFNYEIKKG